MLQKLTPLTKTEAAINGLTTDKRVYIWVVNKILAGKGMHVRGKRQEEKEIWSFIGQSKKTSYVYI